MMVFRVKEAGAEDRLPLILPQAIGEDIGFDVGLVELDAGRILVTAPGIEARFHLADSRTCPHVPPFPAPWDAINRVPTLGSKIWVTRRVW